MHAWQSVATKLDVLQVQTRLPKADSPTPLWLAWLAPLAIPDGIQVDADIIWQAYQRRWPIEPSIRFRKQPLWWTLPQFQLVEAADHWSILVGLAMWRLYL